VVYAMLLLECITFKGRTNRHGGGMVCMGAPKTLNTWRSHTIYWGRIGDVISCREFNQ
jgi:hypothetical protein